MHNYVIKLNNLKFNAIHGVYEEEKNNFQKFEIDIEASYSRINDCKDSLLRSVNYESLYKIAKEIVLNNTFDLIETIGESIIEEVLKEFREITFILVTIRKPEVRFDDNSRCVEVSVSRSNDG